jgi:hypothetical protein
MSTNQTRSKKRRTQVNELPKKQKALTAGDLKKVKGGATYTGSVPKAKTAQKSFDAMDGYIRG